MYFYIYLYIHVYMYVYTCVYMYMYNIHMYNVYTGVLHFVILLRYSIHRWSRGVGSRNGLRRCSSRVLLV